MKNTRQLGISIYPAHQDLNEMKIYVEKAAKLGYTRIFASLLELTEETKDGLLNKFKEIFGFAKKLEFDVCLDVNPRIFNILGVKPDDLKIFNDLNATTIRLDMPMDGMSESFMTFNQYGINVEINMSNTNDYAKNILSFKPLKDRLIACHNFYPQKLAGLDYDFFIEASKKHKELGLRTAAFVSSAHGKQGPWDVSDGLPTLEIHRNLNISTQAKHLWATGLIDDVIIGNAFASDEELKALTLIDRYKITLSVELMKKTSEIEEKIIKLDNHFRRGDLNSYTIRSTQSRVHYKTFNFPSHDNTSAQKRGDVYIGNDTFGIYKGELQLVINDMPNDDRKNLVARVVKDELFLLDFIKSWDRFAFIVEGGKNE